MIDPQLKTVMITGFPIAEIRSRAKEERLDGLFSKPIDWDVLYDLLDTLTGADNIRNQEIPLNIRKRKGPYVSREIVLALVLFILTVFNVQPSKAQPPFYPQNKSMLRMDQRDPSWKSSDLNLTEAQTKLLETLQSAYASEALSLRMEVMSLRFELHYLIRDPNVQPKVLLERQKKISELQAQLNNLSLSYQIKIRSVLTKEQWDRLPPELSMDMGTGLGTDTGIGRGARKGIR